MTDMLGGDAFVRAMAEEAPASAPAAAPSLGREIGALIEIAGSGGQVLLDHDAIDSYAADPDPVLASAGSVGA
jgi:hypothetical protein